MNSALAALAVEVSAVAVSVVAVSVVAVSVVALHPRLAYFQLRVRRMPCSRQCPGRATCRIENKIGP